MEFKDFLYKYVDTYFVNEVLLTVCMANWGDKKSYQKEVSFYINDFIRINEVYNKNKDNDEIIKEMLDFLKKKTIENYEKFLRKKIKDSIGKKNYNQKKDDILNILRKPTDSINIQLLKDIRKLEEEFYATK